MGIVLDGSLRDSQRHGHISRGGQRPELSTAFGRDWTKTPAALLHEEPGGLSLIWASARTRRFRHVGLGPGHERWLVASRPGGSREELVMTGRILF